MTKKQAAAKIQDHITNIERELAKRKSSWWMLAAEGRAIQLLGRQMADRTAK